MTSRGAHPGRGGRLLVRVGVATGLLLGVLGAAYALSLSASRRVDASTQQRTRADAAAERGMEALKLVLDLETGQRGYLITADERFLEPWRGARRTLPGALAVFKRAAVRVGEQRVAATFRVEALSYLRDYSERVVRLAGRDLAAARSVTSTGEGKRRVDQLRARLDDVARRQRRAAAAGAEAADRATARASRVQTGGLALSAAILLSFIGYLVVAVITPIRWTASAARTLRAGELSTRVPARGTREVAELAAAFNEMAATLEANETELRARHQELEAAREDAEAANRAKSEFLSRMSHELRTPLNAILGFAQILEIGDLDAKERGSVRHILSGGHHLLELINEVLDIARIESGELKVSLEPVHVAEIVEEAVAMISPLAQRRQVDLASDGESCAHFHVVADRQRLKQVLLNLLANAVKYNREGGDVHVSCKSAGDEQLRIVVADTGIGIAEHDLVRLFQPFERLRQEGGDVEGTGLGLALTKRLVEAMGGEVHVDSAVGHGSTFCVDLPMTDELPKPLVAAPEPASAAPLGAPSSGPRTVLYIEDNASNVKLLEAILAGRPEVELMVAIQGRLGMELALEHRPDLVLLDLDLPDMPGDEVLRRLRADPRTATTRVVVVSADATPRQVERLLALGADDYLSKPFDIARLLALIDARGVETGDAGGGTSVEPEVPPLDAAFLADLRALREGSRDGGIAIDELLSLFVTEGQERLADLRAAATRGDLATVARAAHALAGTGASVGAFSLAAASRTLEQEARGGTVQVRAAVDGIAHLFAEARAALRSAF